MNIKPSENTNLYGLDNYFNEIIDLYDKEKMPNKILLSGQKGIGKSTLAYHIINYILSQSEDLHYDKKRFFIENENRSFKLIQNNSHPNFYLIDLINDKKNIDIAQIRDMISYTNKSSFNNLPRFILIDNIENLNKNSINALLKIIEEPNKNIFFILIHNSQKKILPTLKSRCLLFRINLSFEDTLKISNFLLNKNLYEVINLELINFYSTPGEIITLINFANDKDISLKELTLVKLLDLFIDNGYYKKNKVVKNLIVNFIELYILKKYTLSNTKNSLLNIYHNFLNKIYNTEKFNLDEESLFLEFKSRLLNG
jgi:DNA polymerase III subunit delta'